MITFDNRKEMINHYVKDGYVGAELGVFEGTFSNFLATKNLSKLHLVDVFNDLCVSGDENGNGCKGVDLREAYKLILERFKDKPFVHVFKGLTDEFYKTVSNDYFDFVYIDAGHSYNCVLNDLENCRNLVKNGGYIMGHDYTMNPAKTKEVYDFGVERAVTDFCNKYHQTVEAIAMDGCTSYCIVNRKA